MALFSFSRWETLPLWLGWLWVEICPLRWTDQALPQTYWAPPLPVPEVRPGIFKVGPPCLTHEEALLKPKTVDMTHTAKREFSIFFFFNLSHCLPGEGRNPAGKHYNHGQVPNKSTCEWIIRKHEETKRQIKEQMGSVTGSSIIPILNPTWTYIPGLIRKHPRGYWKLWISGYKLDPWVGGGKTRIPCIVFRCNISKKITLYSLCLLKAIITILEEEEEIQVQKMCFNSLNDGAWWVLVLKVPIEAKVLKLLHTLTRKIYFCLPIYIYDLSQVNTPGLL